MEWASVLLNGLNHWGVKDISQPVWGRVLERMLAEEVCILKELRGRECSEAPSWGKVIQLEREDQPKSPKLLGIILAPATALF